MVSAYYTTVSTQRRPFCLGRSLRSRQPASFAQTAEHTGAISCVTFLYGPCTMKEDNESAAPTNNSLTRRTTGTLMAKANDQPMSVKCHTCGLMVQVPAGGRRLCGCGT